MSLFIKFRMSRVRSKTYLVHRIKNISSVVFSFGCFVDFTTLYAGTASILIPLISVFLPGESTSAPAAVNDVITLVPGFESFSISAFE
jgi:hypothetical protein